MYIVKRKVNELLTIGDVVIQTLSVSGNCVTLGVIAPRGERIVKRDAPADVYPTVAIERDRDEELPLEED